MRGVKDADILVLGCCGINKELQGISEQNIRALDKIPLGRHW